jgi:two-component system sensor histidine kinase KdpD
MVAGWIVTLAGIALATAVVLPFRARITTATAALVLVVPVALGVAVGGFAVVPLGVAAGFLTFDFVFITPYYTFRVGAGEDWVSLFVYACVGCTVGGVVAQQSRAQREAEAHRTEVRILEEVDRLRNALMGAVSHDLRTPLSSIKASISDLTDPAVALSEADRATLQRTIEEETDRLTRLVANILDISRIQAGALVAHRSASPLDELIDTVVARLTRRLVDHPVTVEIADDLPLVDIDYDLVDQALTNLLENAARHTPSATPVTVEAKPAGIEFVEVRVVDHGPGVAEAERDRIFDQFYRLPLKGHSGGGTAGTGMGLAICKGIVEAHGGRIWVEPTPGGGATFAVQLPAAPTRPLPEEVERHPAERR